MKHRYIVGGERNEIICYSYIIDRFVPFACVDMTNEIRKFIRTVLNESLIMLLDRERCSSEDLISISFERDSI